VTRPDGKIFLTPTEMDDAMDLVVEQRESEKQRAESEKGRADKMEARLRELGVDPSDVS
jgi:hypothetical protein